MLDLETDCRLCGVSCVVLATIGCCSRNFTEPTQFYTSLFLLCTNTSSLELRNRLVITSWIFCQELNNPIQTWLIKLLTCYCRQRNNNRRLFSPWTWDSISANVHLDFGCVNLCLIKVCLGVAEWDVLQTLFLFRSGTFIIMLFNTRGVS